jgi:hypothetical protein
LTGVVARRRRNVCPNPPAFDKIQGLLPSVDRRKQDPPDF